jgi:hypothetical protein
MDIEIEALRRVTNDLLDRLRRDGVVTLQLESDYYWDVPSAVRYDNPEQPPVLEMGQLSDDVMFITELANGSRPPVTYGLVWIASVFRYLGETRVD